MSETAHVLGSPSCSLRPDSGARRVKEPCSVTRREVSTHLSVVRKVDLHAMFSKSPVFGTTSHSVCFGAPDGSNMQIHECPFASLPITGFDSDSGSSTRDSKAATVVISLQLPRGSRGISLRSTNCFGDWCGADTSFPVILQPKMHLRSEPFRKRSSNASWRSS